MAKRTFSYKGQEWEVETTGTATGAGASTEGYLPPVTRWSVTFRQVGNPKTEVRGSIGAPDPNTLDADQLARELGRALRIGGKRG